MCEILQKMMIAGLHVQVHVISCSAHVHYLSVLM